jgi:hypothetical protein
MPARQSYPPDKDDAPSRATRSNDRDPGGRTRFSIDSDLDLITQVIMD